MQGMEHVRFEEKTEAYIVQKSQEWTLTLVDGNKEDPTYAAGGAGIFLNIKYEYK